MKKIKKMKQSENDQSRPIRLIDIIGMGIGALAFIALWATCIGNLMRGNYFGYKNYFGQPAGTFLLLVALAVATPLYIYLVIKTIKEKKVKLSDTLKWMNKPPWKFPWEG